MYEIFYNSKRRQWFLVIDRYYFEPISDAAAQRVIRAGRIPVRQEA